jgi:hypothetical protein
MPPIPSKQWFILKDGVEAVTKELLRCQHFVTDPYAVSAILITILYLRGLFPLRYNKELTFPVNNHGSRKGKSSVAKPWAATLR